MGPAQANDAATFLARSGADPLFDPRLLSQRTPCRPRTARVAAVSDQVLCCGAAGARGNRQVDGRPGLPIRADGIGMSGQDRWHVALAVKWGSSHTVGDTLANPRSGGIIMDVHDPAEAVEVLDLLLKFFCDGELWVKGRLSDRRGNRCLVGALDFVSSHHAIQSDAAERYLADEISAVRDCDDAGVDLARFRASLRQALSGGRYRVSEIVLRRDSFLILTTGVRTSLSCGRSSGRHGRQRRTMRNRPSFRARASPWSPTS